VKVNIQDIFMNTLRKNRTPVTVFTTNGVKITGAIASFDTFTVILSTDMGQQMIFKHAISTIIPSKPVDLRPPETNTPHSEAGEKDQL
jgi:host factor-I protein